MARPMNPDELRTFLTSTPHTGKLGTVGADGRPHVVPIWFDVDEDGSIVFMTGATSVKARNLAAQPWAALCVDDEAPPFSFAMIEGPVTVSDDVEAMRPWSDRIGTRYMGPEKGAEFGARNAVPGEVLIRLFPDHVVALASLVD